MVEERDQFFRCNLAHTKSTIIFNTSKEATYPYFLCSDCQVLFCHTQLTQALVVVSTD